MTETEYKKVPIEEIEKTYSDEKEPIKYGYGMRHIQGLLYFMCLALGYIARGHLGVTIVAMTMVKHEPDKPLAKTEVVNLIVNGTRKIIDSVTSTEGYIENVTTIEDFNENITLVNNETDVDRETIYKTYDWPKSTQEMIHGSFFLGYSIMMFPIGLVCQRWGGKIPLQAAMFVNGIVSLLTPWLVTWGGWKTLCVLRVLQGLSQSGLYPGIQTLLSKWIPNNERASISSYVFTAAGIGTMIAFQSAGILALSRFGWPSTFWATGAACSIGFVLITIFGAANPKEHKSISEAEKIYIMGKVGINAKTNVKIPWKLVLKSVPLWATITTHTGNALCFVFFFVQVPTYMYAVLKLNIKNSGLLSSLPYLVSCFASIAFGYLSDFLTNRKIVSVKTARRIFNSIASVIPCLCLILVVFTTDVALVVTLFVIFLSATFAMHSSWVINYMDLSPNFSGALMATGNTVTNFLVLTLPVLVSNLITDVTNQHQWRITMFLMAAITFVANIVFVLFLSTDVQPWNYGDNNTDDKKEPEDVKLQLEKAEAAS